MNMPEVSNALTEEEFKAALPDKVKRTIGKDLMFKINEVLAEPEMYEQYRDNLLSYTGVMQDGRFKIANYIDAVKYVSHKLAGRSNIAAYSRTFPDKIKRFENKGTSAKDVASYVSAYHKSKLVGMLLEQTLVPTWVLNQDLYQQALNTQAELMINANSEKVRTDAANSLLSHLKQPETQKIQLDIGVKEDSSIDKLRQATLELAAAQRLAVQAGSMNAQEIAHSPVVLEGEATRVE